MDMSHREIIDLWPSGNSLASDLNEKYNTVMRWRSRNSIPADKWVALVEAAHRRDLPVTFQVLAEGKAVA